MVCVFEVVFARTVHTFGPYLESEISAGRDLPPSGNSPRPLSCQKERGSIKETTLARAMGLPLVNERQNKAEAASRDDVSEGSTNCSSNA